MLGSSRLALPSKFTLRYEDRLVDGTEVPWIYKIGGRVSIWTTVTLHGISYHVALVGRSAFVLVFHTSGDKGLATEDANSAGS